MQPVPRRFTIATGVIAALLLGAATVSSALAVPAQAQPEFLFPWDRSQQWYFTSAPHGRSNEGIDFSPSLAETHRPVLAVAGGTVTDVSWNPYGLGWTVTIDHGGGWETLYAHLAGRSALQPGQRVPQGQFIGQVGCSGNCTGVHIHVGLYRNGDRHSWHGMAINGWTVYSSGADYYGYLQRGGTRVWVDGPPLSSANVRRNGCPEPTPTPTPHPLSQKRGHRAFGAGIAGGAASPPIC